MDKNNPDLNRESTPDDREQQHEKRESDDKAIKPNPPRTTSGGITAPKFGSAGSGGAEIEPGPERD